MKKNNYKIRCDIDIIIIFILVNNLSIYILIYSSEISEMIVL
jgi:hypothetical protein